MKRGICAAVAAVAIILVDAPSGTAATQVGSTFTPGTNCNLATYLHFGEPSGSHAVPSAGVITSFGFQGAGIAPRLIFKVARPLGGGNYLIVGESEQRAMAPNALNTVPAQIPVQPGDLIGYYVVSPGWCRSLGATNYSTAFYSGPEDTKVGSVYSFSPIIGQRLDVSATVEPDCDGDGFGDETQDPDTSSCSPTTKTSRTLTLDANKSKVKKGRKVRLAGQVSGVARQGPCESGQTVELQRKRPKQTSFTTFAQVQTDAQGSFSLKKKVKKTFEFRAQVVETAACGAALSNSEKVKVKKRKR